MPTHNIDQLRHDAEAGKAEAQFQLSQKCLVNRDLAGMIHWLRQASKNDFSHAQDALGYCYEKGMGVIRDYDAAVEHYKLANAGGSGLAAYRWAELLYKSRDGVEQKALIIKLLQQSANLGIVPALRVIGYLAIQQDASNALALQCLRQAAQAGDPASCFNLAWFLIQNADNTELRNPEAEAVNWLQRAKNANHPFAEALLAPRQGVEPNRQIDLSKKTIELEKDFQLYPDSGCAAREDLSSEPPIAIFRDVLDIVDCAYLINLSRPQMRPADVINPGGKEVGMQSNVRTSMSTFLPFGMVDFISRYVELKIAAVTGENIEASEPMSILCYGPGQYYRPHFDFFNPALNVSEELLRDGGQRTASAITYLAAPVAGGGTSFPKLNLNVPASAGSTLWFRNCTEDGEIDKRSLHAGDTVDLGEKWVLTKWFRQKATQYLEL